MIPRSPGPDRDFRIFLWVVVLVIALVVILLLSADKAMAQKKTPLQPDWNAIASFYAGRPVNVSVDPNIDTGATTGLSESGKVILGKAASDSLALWWKFWNSGRKNDRMGAAAAGANGLSILLHEAMHNRHFTPGYFDAQNNSTGFRNAGNESQAQALGGELIPDLLHRFFGIPLDSKLSRYYSKVAKGRGEYTSAYINAPTTPLARP